MSYRSFGVVLAAAIILFPWGWPLANGKNSEAAWVHLDTPALGDLLVILEAEHFRVEEYLTLRDAARHALQDLVERGGEALRDEALEAMLGDDAALRRRAEFVLAHFAELPPEVIEMMRNHPAVDVRAYAALRAMDVIDPTRLDRPELRTPESLARLQGSLPDDAVIQQEVVGDFDGDGRSEAGVWWGFGGTSYGCLDVVPVGHPGNSDRLETGRYLGKVLILDVGQGSPVFAVGEVYRTANTGTAVELVGSVATRYKLYRWDGNGFAALGEVFLPDFFSGGKRDG